MYTGTGNVEVHTPAVNLLFVLAIQASVRATCVLYLSCATERLYAKEQNDRRGTTTGDREKRKEDKEEEKTGEEEEREQGTHLQTDRHRTSHTLKENSTVSGIDLTGAFTF